MIYADHAATTPLCPQAREAMEPYLSQNFGNPSAQYRLGLESRRAVEQSRRKIAACLQCRPEEIYFTSGGSEGNTWAVWSGGRTKPVLTGAAEHHSIIKISRVLPVSTRTIPVDETGKIIVPETVAGASLVSVQYANNEVGTIQPVEELSELCRKQGVLFHTDAVQAAGHIPINLKLADMLTASAHKFGGPKGTGFLYVRKGTPLHPFISGGGQESGFRGGTENVAGIVGMAAALEYALAHMAEQRVKLERMEAAFRKTLLEQMPGVRFNGNPDKLPGLISVTVPGRSAEELVYRLDMAGVCVSAGAACSSRGKTELSHVLTAMGVADAACTIRVSFGSTNGISDGAETAKILANIDHAELGGNHE